ncbi:MAG TPA: SMP-30/gluconolactonase/LRE family protein [Bacteroidales bacterium]|jgi:gluconolactonase|nr:SMP-30/gluconolactonase/LRE family protein [Bacteroidales bacterium]
MTRKSLLLSALLSALTPVTVLTQENGLHLILDPGSKLEKLSGEFSFTEGPAADKAGNIYFTDQPNDRIMIWSTDGRLSTFMQPSGRSNGLFFDKQGNLWSCADEKNELWCIGPGNKVTTLPNTYEGKLFNGPNDLWIRSDGSVFFTDPFYKRPWWNHSEMPQEKQCVYYLAPDHKSMMRIADDLKQPNGIIGTPDGKTLYISDIADNKTWVYSINPDGTLSGKRLFCGMGSDGMTIDKEGNIYLTGKGVTVFDKEGNKLGNIPVPENWTANVCFGGKDRKELFITASKGLYRIKARIRGVY